MGSKHGRVVLLFVVVALLFAPGKPYQLMFCRRSKVAQASVAVLLLHHRRCCWCLIAWSWCRTLVSRLGRLFRPRSKIRRRFLVHPSCSFLWLVLVLRWFCGSGSAPVLVRVALCPPSFQSSFGFRRDAVGSSCCWIIVRCFRVSRVCRVLEPPLVSWCIRR